LLLFLEKEEYIKIRILFCEQNEAIRLVGFWGHAPKPPGSASPKFGYGIAFCEAEQRFLPLFLEKEEYSKMRVERP
jgi:hypothetical protein